MHSPHISCALEGDKIIYPVLDREAKNHTLSSGTSPYRPYKGVPPYPPGGHSTMAGKFCPRMLVIQRFNCKYLQLHSPRVPLFMEFSYK